MRTLYIVTGATGEYSDYEDWFVRGFFDHAKAVALRDQLEARARELGVYESRSIAYETTQAAISEMLKLDEHATRIDYTGLTYFIQECPVEDAE